MQLWGRRRTTEGTNASPPSRLRGPLTQIARQPRGRALRPVHPWGCCRMCCFGVFVCGCVFARSRVYVCVPSKHIHYTGAAHTHFESSPHYIHARTGTPCPPLPLGGPPTFSTRPPFPLFPASSYHPLPWRCDLVLLRVTPPRQAHRAPRRGDAGPRPAAAQRAAVAVSRAQALAQAAQAAARGQWARQPHRPQPVAKQGFLQWVGAGRLAALGLDRPALWSHRRRSETLNV